MGFIMITIVYDEAFINIINNDNMNILYYILYIIIIIWSAILGLFIGYLLNPVVLWFWKPNGYRAWLGKYNLNNFSINGPSKYIILILLFIVCFIVCFILYSIYFSDPIHCAGPESENSINNNGTIEGHLHVQDLSVNVSDRGLIAATSNVGLGVTITGGMTALYKASTGLPPRSRIATTLVGGLAGGLIYSGISTNNRYRTLEHLENVKNKTTLNIENVKDADSSSSSSSVANSMSSLDELVGDSSPLADLLYNIHMISYVELILFLHLAFIIICKLYISPDTILSKLGKIINNKWLLNTLYKIILNYNKVGNYYILYLIVIILIIIIYITIMSYNLYINLDGFVHVINTYYKK